MISTVAVQGYRSLRDVALALDRVTLITGPNGSGKSNIYRALRLLADVAQGRLHATLAREGGFPSALWAGPEKFSRAMKRGEQAVQGGGRRNASVALKLGFAGDDYGYAIDLGLPVMGGPFGQDPEIKRELLWTGEKYRPGTVIADRRGQGVTVRDDAGEWRGVHQHLAPFDTMMTHAPDPRAAPEILILRERMRSWRFYDHLRTDIDAPARRPQVGTQTPVLSADGADLAAAIETIRHIGDPDALDRAIDDAFPGARVVVSAPGGQFETGLRQHGLLRDLKAAELSDGTLRYLLLAAALLSPRPPPLLVLNEPETSLHADLLPALGRLIAGCARDSQVIVVTHARALIDSLRESVACRLVDLAKDLSETRVPEEAQAAWSWPPR
ncbi:MAG: AAA family ATPase [Rhodospirillales bacterium]|nr:AAA family ATPase [Rhodospirillales bacterium]